VVTVTLVIAVAAPPAPLQLKTYTVVCDGETLTLPDTPAATNPVPIQVVALVLENVSVAEAPALIEDGLAERVAVGTGVEEPVVAVRVTGEETFPDASLAQTLIV